MKDRPYASNKRPGVNPSHSCERLQHESEEPTGGPNQKDASENTGQGEVDRNRSPMGRPWSPLCRSPSPLTLVVSDVGQHPVAALKLLGQGEVDRNRSPTGRPWPASGMPLWNAGAGTHMRTGSGMKERPHAADKRPGVKPSHSW